MSDSCNLMNCNLPGSSVHGIVQARILEWVAISFSRRSSLFGIEPLSLAFPALTGGFFTTEPPGKPSLVIQFSSVQSLSRVWLFATPWIAACQASLSITNSWSSLRLTSITDSMDVSLSELQEFTETHVHRVSDAIQPSHPLPSPSPLAPNPSQHQSLFQWVQSLHEVAKVLEFQL